jgi:hypothetical protein
MSKTGYTDQNKNAWVIDGTGDNYIAYPSAPAFGVPAGRKLVAASSLQEAQDAIANLVDEYNETGKVIPRGGTLLVDAVAPAVDKLKSPPRESGIGPLLLAVFVLFVLSEKKGRR